MSILFKFKCCFYETLFSAFGVLFALQLSIKLLYVFAHNAANSFIIFPPNLSYIKLITLLFFPLGNGLSTSWFEVSKLVSTSFEMSEWMPSVFM